MELNQPKKNSMKVKIIVVILVLIGIFWSLSYMKGNSPKNMANTQGSITKANIEENKKILENVAKLVLIQEPSAPDVITITDAKTMIEQQPVFKGAINGDKILVFMKEGRAIIYSPSRDIIVNILPVTAQKTTAKKETVTASTTKATTTATTTKSKK
ncbi:MAG: hypothetical protein FGM57_01425 [Candidatus Taylorbacteria bacterium]|nr:hypothetical protein [Candidatus Taylorbacteria bacterium]